MLNSKPQIGVMAEIIGVLLKKLGGTAIVTIDELIEVERSQGKIVMWPDPVNGDIHLKLGKEMENGKNRNG